MFDISWSEFVLNSKLCMMCYAILSQHEAYEASCIEPGVPFIQSVFVSEILDRIWAWRLGDTLLHDMIWKSLTMVGT